MLSLASNNETAYWQDLDRAHHLHPFTDTAALNRKGSRIVTDAKGVYLTDSNGDRILVPYVGGVRVERRLVRDRLQSLVRRYRAGVLAPRQSPQPVAERPEAADQHLAIAPAEIRLWYRVATARASTSFSPTLSRVTPAPTATTSPAPSCPGMKGGVGLTGIINIGKGALTAAYCKEGPLNLA